MLTEQQCEIIAEISKAQAYQRGAWQRVIDDARKYAQMKIHRTYTESNGCTMTVDHSSVKDMEEMFKNNLLRSVEAAFAEDAQMGITISETLG